MQQLADKLQEIKLIQEPFEISYDPYEFLNTLKGPVCFYLKGKNPDKNRVLNVLMHGNEPSGYIAALRWLKESKKNNIIPAVNTAIIIANPLASKSMPYFAHRNIPGGKDLNRSFKVKNIDIYESRVAQDILAIIDCLSPEAVLDIHNTTGNSPFFAVTTNVSGANKKFIQLFTNKVLNLGLDMGTLIEVIGGKHPSISLECGKTMLPESHSFAYQSVMIFLELNDLFANNKTSEELVVFENAVRIELTEDAIIYVGKDFTQKADLIINKDIEKLNFAKIPKDTSIGYVGAENLNFLIVNAQKSNNSNKIEDYFYLENNLLKTTRDLSFFMVTTNPEVAHRDCLFYITIP